MVQSFIMSRALLEFQVFFDLGLRTFCRAIYASAYGTRHQPSSHRVAAGNDRARVAEAEDASEAEADAVAVSLGTADAVVARLIRSLLAAMPRADRSGRCAAISRCGGSKRIQVPLWCSNCR